MEKGSINLEQRQQGEQFRREFERFRQEIKQASIMIVGAAGAGKSQLCNLVLGREVARVGAGKPITQEIRPLQADDLPLTIYDTPGYETGEEKQEAFNRQVREILIKLEDQGQPIDVVWFCVSAPVARFTDLDARLIQLFRQRGKPVAVVLTQVDEASEAACADLKSAIKESLHEEGEEIAIFESTTDETITLEAGIPELREWTEDHLDESRRLSFIAAQGRRLIPAKLEEGKKIIYKRAAAATIGATPIPFSDAMLLAPLQFEMLAQLAYLWGMKDLNNAVSSLVVELVAQNVGKSLAGSLIKMIPGVGTTAGGMINATVAGGMTYAVGTAFNLLCSEVVKKGWEGEVTSIAKLVGDNFTSTVVELYKNYKA